MKFRPCIDLHEGKVKQIVGETLNDGGTVENFVSDQDSAYYAGMFRKDGLRGGHVIMLGKGNEEEAAKALKAYPGGLQIGGGITADNAPGYLGLGASHVIVTSYIFQDGQLNQAHLEKMAARTGKQRLVIDLSCRQADGKWFVATNQWRQLSRFEVTEANLIFLSEYCDEFLVHAVDVEGKQGGIQGSLVEALAAWTPIPTTYAGGVRNMADLVLFRELSEGRLDITVGSALDIFGGTLAYREVVSACRTDRSSSS